MYEDGLGKVVSGVETAPAALEEDATQLQRTQYAKETRRFEEKMVSSSQECLSLRPSLETGMLVLPLKLYKLTLPSEQRISVMVVVQSWLWRQSIG